jgi:hypothetical protein
VQVDPGSDNFRTMAALQRTQRHLRAIMDRTDVPLVEIHKFLWDRYRGIRQDLFVQGFKVPAPICCFSPGFLFTSIGSLFLPFQAEVTVAAVVADRCYRCCGRYRQRSQLL